MAETKDPGFKLFGKTIPMLHRVEDPGSNPNLEQESNDAAKDAKTQHIGEENKPVSEDEGLLQDGSPEVVVGSTEADNCKEGECKKEIPTEVSENGTADQKDEDAAAETNGNEGKTPKKPDRLLPCPRCDSLDTKFCYYNNYNVNQPRHFCKNCQRYWTAGGTMRNVPVGAGRRKNKHSVSHYRHMMMSDGLIMARADEPDAAHHQVIPNSLSPSARTLKASKIQLLPMDIEATGGTVLNFGPETPLCESIATALNLADQAVVNRKVFKSKDEEKGSVACGENRDDISCGSSITAASSCTEKEEGPRNYHSVPPMEQGGFMGWPNGVPQQPFYGGGPWPYGWNLGWGGPAGTTTGGCSSGTAYGSENSNPNTSSWNNGLLGAPGMWAAGIPWPFVPGSYWGSPACWGGTAWNIPWSGTPGAGLSSSPASSNGSGSGSPTLGKHSRDISHLEGKADGCLWVPKTLRIDDPGEAARSSIWTTLGIGNKSESITTGGIFKAFQPKTEEKENVKAPAPGLLANPAAFARSVAFQESN